MLNFRIRRDEETTEAARRGKGAKRVPHESRRQRVVSGIRLRGWSDHHQMRESRGMGSTRRVTGMEGSEMLQAHGERI